MPRRVPEWGPFYAASERGADLFKRLADLFKRLADGDGIADDGDCCPELVAHGRCERFSDELVAHGRCERFSDEQPGTYDYAASERGADLFKRLADGDGTAFGCE